MFHYSAKSYYICDHKMKLNMIRLLRTLALFITGLFVMNSYGQIYKYIGLDDGLSSRNVYAVRQAVGGFMWFLTDNGIDRYDGTEVSQYTLTVDEVKFTEYSSCRFIYDSESDNLWLVTGGGRLMRYSKRNNRFEVMFTPDVSYRRTDIMRCAVSPIDVDGNIWIFVGEQAFCYNVRKRKGRELTIVGSDANVTYAAIISIDASNLYVGTKGEICRGIVDGDTITLTPIDCEQEMNINVNTFYYSSAHRTLVVGTEDAGIMAYREDTREIIHNKDLLPDVRVTRIIPYGTTDEVLIATNAACVYRMALADCMPHPYLAADYTTNYRMNTDNVTDICIDREGQLWLCSFPKGLTVRNDQYPALNWIRRSNLNINTLTNDGINYILEDSDQDLWYATDNGVSVYDTKENQWHTLLSMKDESPNPNHYFLTMCEVEPGVILLGGYAAGIYIINKNNLSTKFVKPDLIIPEKYIQTMYRDETDGSVWLGSENQLFNVTYDGALKVNYAEVFGGINYITRKDDFTLWIGTNNGLYSFNKRTHEKKRIELPLERFKVNTLLQASDGTVYVGTHHHGLIVYNEGDNYYHRYHKDNSALTSNGMKCIVSADNQSLYISSDGGIVRFNTNTERITTWTHDQGLQGVSFNAGAGIATCRHTLMLGSDMGVIEIPANATLPNIYKSKLVLSGLYIGNSRVSPDDKGSPLKDALNNVDRLVLNDAQSKAAIKVKCVNHIYPTDCDITWHIDSKGNKDDSWLPVEEDRFITLGKLPAGRHTLTIRATSNEAGTLLDERVLRITIKPPFYLSWWGLLIELGLLIIVVYSTRRYIKSTNAMHVSDEKINFLINTAHDIRTPLSLIKAPLEELSQCNTLNTEEREAVSLALRNANTLTQMTDNALQYQLESIERGVSRIERHEAIAHIQAQIDKLALLAKTKRQTIEYIHSTEPFDVWVEANKLNSIIQNLLSNAIKYSAEGETITFTLYCESKRWGFHVTDNGIGISEVERRKLFKQLFRGTNAINAKIAGSGIGLLSIGRYVKHMQGHIEVKSQVNGGSDFHVSFPLGKEHYDKQSAEFVDPSNLPTTTETVILPECYAVEPTESSRPRLLIVEDNPELLNYLKRIFDKDYHVYTAINGKEALSKLPYVQPSIVLTDVMMPEMRGDDLCVSIKSNIDTSHIGVVLISALSDQGSIIKGLSVKADAYVTKPFDVKILQLTIANLIESRQQLSQRLAALDDLSCDVSDAASELDLKLMNEMKEVIERNMANSDFTIDTLAYELRISRTTLYNKIKGLTGNNPSDFIRTCRINRAKTLLSEHRYTIAEVTDRVGFADQKYFREVFKKAVGMTPSEYAKTRVES